MNVIKVSAFLLILETDNTVELTTRRTTYITIYKFAHVLKILNTFFN